MNITHKEARKAKERLVRLEQHDGGITYAQYGLNYSAKDAIKDCNLIDDYFTQQEKVLKLLELYKTASDFFNHIYYDSDYAWLSRIYDEIKALEEELK